MLSRFFYVFYSFILFFYLRFHFKAQAYCAPPSGGLLGVLRGNKPRGGVGTETGVNSPPSGGSRKIPGTTTFRRSNAKRAPPLF